METVYIVIDRDNKHRILGIFSNLVAAQQFAYNNNGVEFERFVHHTCPEKTGYIK